MIRTLDNYKNCHSQTVEDSFLTLGIEKLLPEILQFVFSILQPKDIQATALVSKQWKIVSILTARDIFFLSSKEFSYSLGKLIPEKYPTQIKKLLDIENSKKIINFTSLNDVKSSIEEHKENILSALQELDVKDINKVEELAKHQIKPIFFEYMFDLAKLYKEMKIINGTAGNDNEMVIDLVKDIWDEKFRNEDFNENNVFEKWLKILYSMPNIKFQSQLLVELSYMYQGRFMDIKKVIKIATSILDEKKRNEILYDASDNADDDEMSLEAANLILDDLIKSKALHIVVKKFVRASNIKRAIEISDLIPDINLRCLTYREIAILQIK